MASIPEKGKFYLTNKEFYTEIVYSKAVGRLTSKAKLMLELLAKRTIKKMRYRDIDLRNDCYQSGLLDIFDNWMDFNEEKGDNAFAYFTEIFKRGLAKGLQQYTKYKGSIDPVIIVSIDGANDGQGMHNF